MDYMADRVFSSYALDLTGHGRRMAEGVVGLGIMDYVARVESVVAELAPANPILIGHSMGGLIVQEYLERNASPSSSIRGRATKRCITNVLRRPGFRGS